MFERQIRIQTPWGSKDMNVSDRANGENRGRSSSGPFSWYLAQRPLPGLKYVATINGYVILS
jgi:hypothetical protein